MPLTLSRRRAAMLDKRRRPRRRSALWPAGRPPAQERANNLGLPRLVGAASVRAFRRSLAAAREPASHQSALARCPPAPRRRRSAAARLRDRPAPLGDGAADVERISGCRPPGPPRASRAAGEIGRAACPTRSVAQAVQSKRCNLCCSWRLVPMVLAGRGRWDTRLGAPGSRLAPRLTPSRCPRTGR